MNQDQFSHLPHEKIAFNYFKKLSKKRPKKTDDYFLLNQEELAAIRKVQVAAMLKAALFGTLGVLSFYLPIYFFPFLFPNTAAWFPFLGPVELPIIFTLYGVFLAIFEIMALTILNLKTVHQIAFICGFPQIKDPLYHQHIQTLFEVSLEKPARQLLAYGINPFAGLSRWSIFFFTLFNTLKATLSNLFIKVILARILGRFALRAIIDLVGIPVFAFWNAYGTNRVIREAKIRIMAPVLIRKLVKELYTQLKDSAEFKTILFDALQFIAAAKRSFHHNHFILVESLFQKFDLKPQKQKALDREELIDRIKALKPETKEGLAKLFVFGILIDGHFSSRERRILEELDQKDELINFDFQSLKNWEKSFREGRGLDKLFETNLVKI